MILRAFFLSIIAVLLLMALWKPAKAEAIAATEQGGVRIVLYSEKCAIKGVANLPHRASFHENGKTYEGCAGMSPFGLILFYFSDETVFAVPVDAFSRLRGA